MIDEKEKKCIDCAIEPDIKKDLEALQSEKSETLQFKLDKQNQNNMQKLEQKQEKQKQNEKETEKKKKEVKKKMGKKEKEVKKEREVKKEEKQEKEKKKELGLKIEVDFKEYEELYKKLVKQAHQDFRTPELEILWILNEFFKN